MKKTICLLVALAAVLLDGTSSFGNEAELVISNTATETLSSGSAAAAYWTPERMQNAKPYPIPTLSGSPQPSPATLQQAAPGPPGFVPGQTPQGSALLRGDESMLHALAGGSQNAKPSLADGDPQVLAAGYDYPPPHTTYLVYNALYGSTRSLYPYKAIGRVFFTDSHGVNYACTGTSIGGQSVLTAGHCVHEGDGSSSSWHSNWVFIPNYRNTRQTTTNTWKAETLWIINAWYLSRDFAQDIGCAKTAKKGTRTLSSRVGSLGLAWNQSSTQHWATFGYPAQSPYDGKWLVQTDASFSRADATYTPNPVGIGTTQNAGSSGGPRIINFTPGLVVGANNYVNGVTSYRYLDQPNEVFSPYFGDGAHNLFTACLQ